jgi:putative transcriptional regulator
LAILLKERIKMALNTNINFPKLKKISGGQIKKLRKKEGISRLELSILLNITEAAIYRWESGIANPSGTAMTLLNLIKRKGINILIS